jgi:histidinol-phosphate aminotransferase
VIAERERFLQALATVPGIRAFPSAANFVLIRLDSVPAGVVFRRLLEEDGILIRDVSHSPGLAECLRISIGEREDMDAVLRGLRRILGGQAAAEGHTSGQAGSEASVNLHFSP